MKETPFSTLKAPKLLWRLRVSIAGCKKKTETDGDKSEKATADEEGGKKKKGGDGESYSTGTALKHLPKACKGGRIYLTKDASRGRPFGIVSRDESNFFPSVVQPV